MANQVLAAKMIPRLGVTGLASPPPGRLPSHLDLLRLLYHQQHYNLVGFQGLGKICCKIDGKSHKARCLEGNDLMVQDGVHSGQEPLLVSTDEAQLGDSPPSQQKSRRAYLRAMGKEQYEKMSKKSFDEQNCPEVTRSQGVLSCSSLEVDIAAGSKYLF